MIDLKNYKRLTTKKKERNIVYGNCDANNDSDFKGDYITGTIIDKIAELEDMIEQGKLVEKSEPKTAKERVEFELKELSEKVKKLDDFMQTSKYNELSIRQRELLCKQLHTMFLYVEILKQRLKNWER